MPKLVPPYRPQNSRAGWLVIVALFLVAIGLVVAAGFLRQRDVRAREQVRDRGIIEEMRRKFVRDGGS